MSSTSNILVVLAISLVIASVNCAEWDDLLGKSLLFYYAQRCGDLPESSDNRVPWRSDAFLSDGVLKGGYFDAGDYIKFNFPQAWSMTILSWGAIEYEQGHKAAGEWDNLLDTIRYGTDYLMACMDEAQVGQFYCQVGDAADHSYWGPPPLNAGDNGYPSSRSAQATTNGADLASEMAAAFAAASIVFASEDATYSATLLAHAKTIYAVAESSGTKYSCGVGFYNSFAFEDEVVWGALWLYRATGTESYLTKAKSGMNGLNGGTAPSWDDKKPSAYVLGAIVDPTWTSAKTKAKSWADATRATGKTPGGMVQFDVSQWGGLRHAQNAAFVMFIYADKVAGSSEAQANSDWALGQLNYAFGSNPSSRTYMTGVDATSPKKPHHRSSHGGTAINTPPDSAHVLIGALVGGPGSMDDYEDRRDDFIKNEVALDYNAGLTGSLARMIENTVPKAPTAPVATEAPTTKAPVDPDAPVAVPPNDCFTWLYQDALASQLSDWSWSSDVKPDFASTGQTRGSKSISFVPKGNGQSGLQIACTSASACLDVSSSRAISFWVHGGNNGGQEIRVELKSGDNVLGTATFTAEANKWTYIEKAISNLGSPSSISGVQFLASGSSDLETVWIDDIGLIKNGCFATDEPATTVAPVSTQPTAPTIPTSTEPPVTQAPVTENPTAPTMPTAPTENIGSSSQGIVFSVVVIICCIALMLL